MAVTKRTRYEVLRRDNHTCRYCGGRAPNVELTVDHVTPTALGGSDDPSNLVAACRDCNAGKAASNPDAPLVAQVQDDALRWAAAMRAAVDGWIAARSEGFEYGDVVARQWDSGNQSHRWGRAALDEDWVDTCERWRALGVPVELVADAVGVAMRRKSVQNRDVWRYACGIVWNKLTELQEAASASLAPAVPEGHVAAQQCPDCHYVHEERCNFWGGWRIGYIDCALMSPDVAAAHTSHPDHYQALALSLVVDQAAHHALEESHMYRLFTGRTARAYG